MATKTLILRPTKSDFAGGVTCYPSDVTVEQSYSLVTEVVPDNDATYLLMSYSASLGGFGFTLPEEYFDLKPSSIKAHAVMRTDGDSVTGKCSYIIPLESTTNTGNVSLDFTVDSAIYTEFIFALPDDSIELYYNNGLKGEVSSSNKLNISISPGSKEAKGDAAGSFYLTQLYLELTYDIDDPIYIKSNGLWIECSGDIYQKQNGTWVSVDSTIFENGDKYIFIKEDDQ